MTVSIYHPRLTQTRNLGAIADDLAKHLSDSVAPKTFFSYLGMFGTIFENHSLNPVEIDNVITAMTIESNDTEITLAATTDKTVKVAISKFGVVLPSLLISFFDNSETITLANFFKYGLDKTDYFSGMMNDRFIESSSNKIELSVSQKAFKEYLSIKRNLHNDEGSFKEFVNALGSENDVMQVIDMLGDNSFFALAAKKYSTLPPGVQLSSWKDKDVTDSMLNAVVYISRNFPQNSQKWLQPFASLFDFSSIVDMENNLKEIRDIVKELYEEVNAEPTEKILLPLLKIQLDRIYDRKILDTWLDLIDVIGDQPLSLEFLDVNLTDSDLSRITKNTCLNKLDLKVIRQITDAGLEHLKELTNLTSLNLSDCDQITDTGLEHLKALSNLTSLDLGWCEKITNVGLKHLKALSNLASLNMRGCFQITDTGLEHLKSLSSLTRLHLASCENITDTGLEHLKSLSSLTRLHLAYCKKISDPGLEHLKGLSNLTRLDLGRCEKITDAGLEHIKALSNLTTLNLGGCKKITDAGLEHLKAFSNLTTLNLGFCEKITDDGLRHLKDLSNLNSLNLSHCSQITDAGLEHFEAFSNLTSLGLKGCDNITDAGVRYFKKLGNGLIV